jgi:hypothetical protein
MITMQTMTNKTASHISEMLIIGSNMGIIDAEPSIVNLMEKLLRFEENNVQQLKQFL